MDLYTGERRGDLLRLNLPALHAKVQSVLSTFPDLSGAYLFGSALDFVRSTSDIDLGLVFPPGLGRADAELLAGRIESTLGKYGPHRFQTTVLLPEENHFTFTVLRDGELIYCAHEEVVTDLIEVVGRQHDDLAPFRHTFLEALGVIM